MPFLILLTLFVIVPIAEISLLIKVAGSIGGLSTILFVIFTAVLGAYLVRQQGLSTLMNLQTEMGAGKIPAMQIAEGVALLFAGAVLLTPGFITDALGFALLTPPIRRTLITWIMKQGFIKAQTTHSGFNGRSNTTHNHANVIEGEYSDKE